MAKDRNQLKAIFAALAGAGVGIAGAKYGKKLGKTKALAKYIRTLRKKTSGLKMPTKRGLFGTGNIKDQRSRIATRRAGMSKIKSEMAKTGRGGKVRAALNRTNTRLRRLDKGLKKAQRNRNIAGYGSLGAAGFAGKSIAIRNRRKRKGRK